MKDVCMIPLCFLSGVTFLTQPEISLCGHDYLLNIKPQEYLLIKLSVLGLEYEWESPCFKSGEVGIICKTRLQCAMYSCLSSAPTNSEKRQKSESDVLGKILHRSQQSEVNLTQSGCLTLTINHQLQAHLLHDKLVCCVTWSLHSQFKILQRFTDPAGQPLIWFNLKCAHYLRLEFICLFR